MDNLIANGRLRHSKAVSSVGKIQLTDADGPASLNNNFTGVGFHRLPGFHRIRLHLEQGSGQAVTAR